MRRILALLLPPPCAALAFALTAGPASAATRHAALDGVSATLSYSGSASAPRNLHLRIVRDGATALDAPVRSHVCGTNCDTFGGEALRILDLNGDGQPVVILDLFTGGAHCCELVQLFTFRSGSTTPVKTEHNFGDVGARPRRLGPGPGYEFLTADEAFVYEFTSFATSGFPVQVLRFDNGRFVDVTRSYPALIRADARSWWKLYVSYISDGEGAFAAWAADEELLNHPALVTRTIARELRANRLHGDMMSGKRFAKTLPRLLKRYGYIRR